MTRINEVPNLQQYAQTQNSGLNQNASLKKPTAVQEADPSDDKKKYAKNEVSEGDNLDGNLEEGFEEGRNRRRSKNDVDGRIHKCKYCDKTYLSYPALYTHTKQKHSMGPDGEQRAPPTSGRGRGRPRKHVSGLTN